MSVVSFRGIATALFGLVVATGCGGSEPLVLPEQDEATVARSAPDAVREPAGEVVVAYPDVPASWHGVEGDDPAATDLSALWGLPLYHYGPDGVLRPALVAEAATGADNGGWYVDLTLRSGRWSDGEPVTASDVVATVEALRASPREAEFAVVESAEALAEDTVRLTFAEPYPRWPHLLSGGPGVLPAHVLAQGGLAAYEETVPVAAGWFTLTEFEPGLRAVFAANEDGPLGAPALERVEVLFTPRFETALGLLDDGRVQVVLGHLALNPVGRGQRLGHGVEAAAPLGGTMVVLEWPTERVDAEVRRAFGGVIDVGQLVEGLLGRAGAVATSPWPGVDGPWPAGERRAPEERSFGTIQLLLPRWHEVTGFTARALQRDLGVLEGTLEILSEETPGFVASSRDADLVLRIRRDGPRPSLARLVAAVTPELRAADAAPFTDAAAVAAGFEEVAEQARFRPLYRAGVAHVWSDDVGSVRPSSWPGVGLWNVGEWSVGAP